VTAAAEATGGGNHGGWLRSMPQTFERIYAAFRQCYVLRYRPAGVAAGGWHAIEVAVNRPGRHDVVARRGYYGGGERR
jgi:hypothetical protein